MGRKLVCVAALLSTALLSGVLHGQQSPDATKPPTDAWPTYHGDYKANHFSPVKTRSPAPAGSRRRRPARGRARRLLPR